MMMKSYSHQFSNVCRKLWAAAFIIAVFVSNLCIAGTVPSAAAPYQRQLTREVRLLFGLSGAPIAVLAGQIEQESAWNANASSKFADGLSQFTPSTAAWISGTYPATLGSNQPFNPEWAIRALVQYDYDLHKGVAGAAENCSRWAMALSAYNGGAGWLARDRSLCTASGCDPSVWFGQVERFTSRSPSAAQENRGYPRRILLQLQDHYSTWSEEVSCSVSKGS